MRKAFVGRSRELETLDNLWTLPNAALLILYGRRRVGKTRLLTRWLRSHASEGLYWVAEPASELTQLRSFSQAILNFFDPNTRTPPEFSFATWEQALRQIPLYARDRRIALFIDEVTYLIDVNPEITGILQKAWDQWLGQSNLFLALSGSQMGLMQKQLLNYDAPLYGRATAQMKLPQLPYGATKDFFPSYTPAERVMIYSMWGGVPAYWERINPNKTVLENLRQHILPEHAWMIDESRILLQDFINDLHNYVGIIRAIADDQHSLSQISQRTGLPNNKLTFYLSVLRDTGFVTRIVPLSQRGTDSRRGRYMVTDPYLRFFYRFMSAYQSRLALGELDQMLQIISTGLPEFIETYTWRDLCQEWLLRASANHKLPLSVAEVGSEWSGNNLISVAGIDESKCHAVVGDCFWGDQPKGVDAVQALLSKTSMLVPANKEWSVYYTLFSNSGWTPEAQHEAEQLLHKRSSRWNIAGIRLLDLQEVDDDLTKWSV